MVGSEELRTSLLKIQFVELNDWTKWQIEKDAGHVGL